MKKQLFFSFFIFCTGSMLAQSCPLGVTTDQGVGGASESMIGQTFRNSCGFSLASVTVSLQNPTDAALTMNIRSSACSGTILKTATSAAGTSGSRTFTLPSTLSLAANTTYFIEITGTIANVSKLRIDGRNPYTNGSQYYSNASDGTCVQDLTYDLTFTLGGTVLPVELTQFDANTEGSKNNLTWRTESETNNKGFDIERSTDGSTFHNIGQVKGNNKPSSYQFVDNQPFATSYYRLRQIDFDGTETFSKIVSVQLKNKGKGLKVYPNPVSSLLTIDYTEGSDFQILNLLGQQVLTGKTGQRLDVSALPQGTYILKVGAEQAKFVKQ